MKIYPKMFHLNDIFYLSKASMKMKIDPSTSPYVDNVLFLCVKCSNALGICTAACVQVSLTIHIAICTMLCFHYTLLLLVYNIFFGHGEQFEFLH